MIVCALGVTQIIAWGSSFYLLAVLAPAIVRDTGWTYDRVVAGVSLGLLTAGLVSPRVGRLIARHGGRRVLGVGALIFAVGFVALGLAPNLIAYLAAWIVMGVGMGAGLYDAAFSTVGSIYGGKARGVIAAVTLVGGFASTVCWPISAFLVEHVGWRGACFAYAAVQIGIALPIHLLALPRPAKAVRAEAVHAETRLHRDEVLSFALLAAAVTVGAAVLALVGTHLVAILQARGFTLSAAVALGMLIGPSAVGARAVEMLAGRRYHPIWTMVASVLLVATAAAMLLTGFRLVGLAIILYAGGNGIGTVARGTVPLALFGAGRYPLLMGRLALPLMIAMAVSPFAGGLAFRYGGAEWTLALLMALATLNVGLVGSLLLVTRGRRAASAA
ncbi:MAG TPA: MFS transporter [Pseudolabrys sp.]|nr:MFS transporter [Pseudolabrys sp.]